MIVAISRESGSGGHEIGKRLAKKLDIEFYDKFRIAEIAASKKMDVLIPGIKDEKRKSFLTSFMWSLENDELYELVKEISTRESCVIVGRCADHILKETPDVTSVFLHADMESKIARIMERKRVNAERALQIIQHSDKQRKLYFEKYTNSEWGNATSYDICLNTAYLGLDGCVDSIITIIDRRLQVAKCYD